MPWSDLLPRLTEMPRENGSAALRETADWLAQALREAGVEVAMVPFAAEPYRLRLAGVVALLGGIAYAACLRARRPWAALAAAVLLPAVLLLELDGYVPIVGWIGRQPQVHVVGRLPAAAPAQRLLLTAHYDTKTDALDHVERAPIQLLGLPVTLLMVAGALLAARRRGARAAPLPRTARAAVVAALVYSLALFVSLSGGALMRARSPGALDNGAACALLVRLAERLAAAGPLPRTEVEVVLLSAEEAGVQGSWVYARARFAQPPALPTAVINLEFVGAAPDLAVFGSETFTLRSYPADPRLVALLDEVHRAQRQRPLHATWYGAATDARSFLAHGIPAATLASDLPGHALPRHLHSAADDRARVDEAALDANLAFLEAVVHAVEAGGLGRDPS